MAMLTIKQGPGRYAIRIIRDGRVEEWIVSKVYELRGEWVAYLDKHTVLDPISTLREVKDVLRSMSDPTK
jgi:hypothetical protein